jgi:cytochrome P450
MRVFRRDFFRRYEQDVIPRIFADVIKSFPPGSSADVVDLGYRFMVFLSIAFAGIDRQAHTQEELDTLVRMLRLFGVSATLGQAIDRDKDAARIEIRAAVAEFDQRFFMPSCERRQQLIAEVIRGERSADELPMDVLTVLLQNRQELGMDREGLLREVAFYFLAGAHTSVHSLGHAVHHLLAWCAQHDGARAVLEAQPALVQRFVHESFRLHPSSPVAVRIALEPVDFADGQHAEPGDRVTISLHGANRCTGRFGADADQFNPYREPARGTSETGITFGLGMHACLGRNLAAGMLASGTSGAEQQLGMVTFIAHQLLRHGIEVDPMRTARLDRAIARETWAFYPVRFRA